MDLIDIQKDLKKYSARKDIVILPALQTLPGHWPISMVQMLRRHT